MRQCLIVPVLFLIAACAATSGNAPQVAPELHVEEVTYDADGVECHGYLAYDPAVKGERPGVLVVHEWWGHNEYARRRARMLAELGYTALAVDMYGEGRQAAHPADAQKFMMEIMGNIEAAKSRFVAAQELLIAHSTTEDASTAAIGYCMGGAVVLQMARQGLDLDGVASFHGSLGTDAPAGPGDIRARLLVLHGAADPFVSAEDMESFHREMVAAGADLRFIEYPGAKHAFTNPDATAMGVEFGLPLAYDADADEQSWVELEGFLEELYGR
ncbi:MAG: dienelactone hydrolase [Chlamydiales bacterium]|jgi:dienelactone hydrolase